MCGIAGVVSPRPVREELLRAMTDTLAHRGPDAAGTWLGGANGLHCGLGHRRLSIVDLSESANQPMVSGELAVSFNGEIYNHRSLRAELTDHGHVFTTQSDTEVLLHGYRQWGPALLPRLNGMFAFALWDGRSGRLLLARDRFGQKPLHWRLHGDTLAFASEPKALLAMPDCPRRFDPRALALYLAWEYVPAPWCIYEGVHKLPAGHLLAWGGGEPEIRPWWSISFPKPQPEDEPTREKRVIELLKASVERRLMSDVPLGVFLSGGIDSSAIVALLTEMKPAREIATFSVGFAERSFDETTHARRVARLFGTDHHEEVLSPDAMLGIQPEIFARLDEPYADASIIPTYLLSRFTRGHVTVALGGDGGDELFAGYAPFLAHLCAEYYETLVPRGVHERYIHPFVNRLPVRTGNMSLDFRLKHFMRGVYHPAPVRNQLWLGSFAPKALPGLLTPQTLAALGSFDPYAPMQAPAPRFRDGLDEIAWHYQRLYLADDILFKIDRASMMVSLEARSPFLDVTFAEYANSLPSRLKLHRTVRKYVLKRALAGRLPRDILHRPKKGFGIPLAKWFKGPLLPELRRTLAPERLRAEGTFNVDAVTTLIADHAAGRKDNRKPLWTLYVWHKWRENYLDKAL